MKWKQIVLFSLLPLISACLTGSGSDSADAQQTTAAGWYHFESSPRAVLTEIGEESSRDPRLAVRASGALYLLGVVSEGRSNRLGLFISRDGGDHFSGPVPVSRPGAGVVSHGENSPSLAFGDTEIYALWEQRGQNGNTDLMFARSLNFGHHFEEPIPVTDKTAPSTNAFSTLAVAPDGQIYAAWLDGRDNEERFATTSSLYLARSSDRGASFGPNIRVADEVCPCCRPTLAFGPDSEVYVAWRQVLEDEVRDMAVAVSRDQGNNFSHPTRAAHDNWKISGCPHSGASMLHDGKRLYLSWYTAGDSGRGIVQLAWSEDDGESFSEPVEASAAVLDPNHPFLATSPQGHLLPLFEGRKPGEKQGWGSIQPFLVTRAADGTISAPQLIADTESSVSYPVLAADPQGNLFVAWTASGKGGSRTEMIRGRPDNPVPDPDLPAGSNSRP